MVKLYVRFLLVAFSVIIFSNADAQTTYSSVGSGDATNTNNWDDGFGGHPTDFVSGDDFIILNGHTMTVTTGTWSLDCNSLTINASGALTISGSANVALNTASYANTLTIFGSYTHNSSAAVSSAVYRLGNFDAASTFTVGGGSTQTFNAGAMNFGVFVVTGSTTINTNRNINLSGNLTVNSGSNLNFTATASTLNSIGGGFSTQSGTGNIDTKSTAASPIPSGISWSGNISYSSASAQTIVGGVYVNINGTGGNRTLKANETIQVSNTFTKGSGTYTAGTGNTVQYNGTIAQSVIDITYTNLNISNTGTTVTTAGNVVVNGVLTVGSGAVLDMGTTTLTGTLTSTAGAGTIRTQNTSATPLSTGKTWSPTVEYNRTTGGQTIVDGTYTTLILSNTSGTNTASGAISATNLTLNTNSILNMSTFALSGLGGTISGSGTLQTANTSGAPLPAAKTWPGPVIYNSGSAQTIVQGTYGNLTTSGGNRTFDNTGNINISGVFTPGSGTYTSTGSAVKFNASGSQNVPGVTGGYNDLTISNTGTKTMTGDVSVAGTLTLSSASDYLSINGNTLTIQGSTALIGAIKGSSTSNLTVSGSVNNTPTITLNAAASDSLLNTLTLNKTGGGGLSLGSNVGITNLLAITNGNFGVNGKIVTLKSTSITNTAQVGTIGGSITYGTNGSFTVERYVPNSPTNNRAFRDLAPGVNTNTGVNFFQTWQESGGTPSGYGTHITGLAGASPGGVDATTGLDITQTGNVSMYSYVNGTFSAITNTKTTKPNAYQAYRILIRGDRNTNLYLSPQPSTMSSATALRANGQLVTGTVTYTTSGVSGGLSSAIGLNTNNSNGDYSLLGNPYVAALDWNALSKTNVSGTYWVYDATIGTIGAYVTWDGATNSNPSSNVNQYIQPGQGFFVQTTAASPQLVIAETNKATSSTLTGVFRTTAINKLALTLSNVISGRGNVVMDGAVVVFDPNDNNAVDGNDAEKFSNNTENLAIYRSGKRISIEHRKPPVLNDTIPLRLTTMSNSGSYTITLDTRNMTSSVPAYVVDKFLNTEKLVKPNDTTNIAFTVNTADTTSFMNRYYVVFKNGAVPLSTISVKAYTKDNGAMVEWKTTQEVQLNSYEVEKSTNATNYTKMGTVTANNAVANSYTLFDAAPQKGMNYYRIKIIGQDGSYKYSNTVQLNLTNIKETVSVYPNPIKGNSVSLQLGNLEKGTYTVTIFNSIGQTVHTQTITHNGSYSTQTLEWSNKLAKGQYTLSIANNASNNRINKPIFIEE